MVTVFLVLSPLEIYENGNYCLWIARYLRWRKVPETTAATPYSGPGL